MDNNDKEDVKVIKFNPKNNNNEDQKENAKSDMQTDNQNDNLKIPIKKKVSKLRVQRTKAPKVYMENLKKQKKGGLSSLFSCCLPSGKDEDEDDE